MNGRAMLMSSLTSSGISELSFARDGILDLLPGGGAWLDGMRCLHGTANHGDLRLFASLATFTVSIAFLRV